MTDQNGFEEAIPFYEVHNMLWKNALITQLTDKNGLAPKDIHNTDV